MQTRLLYLFLLVSLSGKAQTLVSGKLTGSKNEPVVGANVWIEGSYDGTSSQADGSFSFSTHLKGKQTLHISSIEFEAVQVEIECKGKEVLIRKKLKASVNTLTAVSITAGAMEASDEKRSVVFKPLDVVTTSGALGDVVGALNTLPGTATVGSDGRLLVRGGDASETAIFFDGLQVGNAYGTTTSGVPTRGRFNPMLFKGTFFSTGGYSAEYGNALSSVLSLETNDVPARTQTDLSLMTVGGALSHTRKFEKSAVIASGAYTDLSPYQAIVPQNFDWERAPFNYNVELMYRHSLDKNTQVKTYYTHQGAGLHLYQQKAGEAGRGQEVEIGNAFDYANVSVKSKLHKNWLFRGGLAATFNSDKIRLDSLSLKRINRNLHAKGAFQGFLNNRFAVLLGGEYFLQDYKERIEEAVPHERTQMNQRGALFGEATYHLTADWAVRGGLRGNYNQANTQFNLAPRLSSTYRLHKGGELSAAFGRFFQQPRFQVLWDQQNAKAASATHYLINYQFVNNARTFRAELFYKEYDHLLFTNAQEQPHTEGSGFARGFDLFYRDRKSIRNLDFWITYSFIDSKRQYARFQEQVQPSFAPKHNVSVVGKYWIQQLNSQLGSSFRWNDGLPYDNPNLEGVQESKTSPFASLDLNWSYLPQPNLIIHAEVTNILGRRNVFGYRYSEQPDANGRFASLPIGQGADRFFFIGVFITFSKDKKANQLNNL